MWLILLLITVIPLLLYFLVFKQTKDFWEPYGVTQVPHSTIRDNLEAFWGKKTISDMDETVYHSLGKEGKLCGVVQMQQPFLIVKDLDIVKKILIKDFEYFIDRRIFAAANSQPILSKMIGNLHGEEWKGVRASLSPTFTTGKIRRMMEYFNRTSNQWSKHFRELLEQNGGKGIDINVMSETTAYAVDVIASAVFGMDAGSINNPNSLFAKYSKRLAKVDKMQIIKFGLAMNFPKLCQLVGLKLIHSESLDFFENILTRGLKARLEGKEKKNDFLQLIAEARKGQIKAEGSDELSTFEKDAMLTGDSLEKKNWLEDDLIAMSQMIGFLFAGFSTTSNFIGFMMYFLALNQDCQDKLREEVNNELFQDDDQNVDYDKLNRLNYLEMFVCEALRKAPPLGRLERKCVKDYTDKENNFRVPKGAYVGIPVQAIHNDKQYYEYPDKFYPEHFSPENKAKRNPYAYMPFGIGPRNCIGMRFALVESKAAIVHLVHHYRIEPSKKTPVPMKAKPIGLGVQVPDDLELKLTPICA